MTKIRVQVDNGSGKWETLSPAQLTVLRASQKLGVSSGEVAESVSASQLVSNLTGDVAKELVEEGWFTEDEYVEDLVARETETLLEELSA